jgi:hypothetical protein
MTNTVLPALYFTTVLGLIVWIARTGLSVLRRCRGDEDADRWRVGWNRGLITIKQAQQINAAIDAAKSE